MNTDSPRAAPIRKSELSDLNHTLDRLLNDDDEELRDGASDIVRKALGVSSPICRDRANELWCKWVGEHLRELDQGDRQPWLRWFSSTPDLKDVRGSIAPTPLAPTHTTAHAIFAKEPANLFRDD